MSDTVIDLACEGWLPSHPKTPESLTAMLDEPVGWSVDPDNWRSHVPVGLVQAWPSLSLEVRAAVYLMARHQTTLYAQRRVAQVREA